MAKHARRQDGEPDALDVFEALVDQVTDDLEAGNIDAEEAAQRLIDAGMRRPAAEEYVDEWLHSEDKGKARMITWSAGDRVTYRGDLPCGCQPGPHAGTVIEAVPGGGHGAQRVTVEFDCGLYADIPGDELAPEPDTEQEETP
jgi:hypothetical protein